MNILGEGFNPIILQQIEIRQKLLGAGFNSNNPRTPEYISYARTPTSFVRLMSSVSIENLDVLNNPYVKTLNLTGTALAQKAVLFGGVKGYGESLKGGITDITQIGNQSVFNNFAYGWGGTEYGLRPMPGIQSANIKNESLGSLKTSTLQIKAWNKSQFEIIDTLYMRLGFYVLLEWGHTLYVNNSNDIITNMASLESEFFSNAADVENLQKKIIKNRYDSCGNYDAILGRIVNFSWTFNKDGSYDITIIIRSLGDVIESLKANVLTVSPSYFSDKDNLIIGKAEQALTEELNTNNELSQQNQALRNSYQNNPNYQIAKSPSPTKPNTPTSPSTESDSIWKEWVKTSNPAVNKSNIHARLYRLKIDLDQQISDKEVGGITSYLSDNKLIDVAKATFKSKSNGKSNNSAQYYIRFGALLRIIQGEVIPTIYKGSIKYKLINIDYDEPTNLINFIDSQVSTDPSKILIKRDIKINDKIIKTFPGTTPFEVNINNETYGKLMNVYINYEYLFSIMDKLIETPGSKVTLVSFLQDLGDCISRYLGGINSIVPIIDEDTNTIKFIDQNLLYKKESVISYINGKYNNILHTKPGVFDLYGYNANDSGSAGFIKEFNLKTELTPAFASMITIAAAARSKVVGEDATALSRLNKGLKSSLFEYINDEYIAVGTSSSLDEQYKSTVDNYLEFLNSINMFPEIPEWDPIAFDSYTSVLNTFIAYSQQLKVEATSSATTSTGFIPINVSLNMIGMSGMKIYQEFTLKTDFLPSNYQTEMSWLIKGVNHTIENNSWSTTIESLSLPITTTKPDSYFKLANIINSQESDRSKLYLISESYRSIVEKIIAKAKEYKITDKDQLTAILTVAQAESGLTVNKIENFNYNVKTPEGITRVKNLFKKLRDKNDVEIKNIFSTPQSAANFLYNLPGSDPNDGYLYRGRGLTQTTFKVNYQNIQNILEDIYPYLDLVKHPDNILKEQISIDALILGKIKGAFGEPLKSKINYINNPIEIIKTQNKAAIRNQTIISHYTLALNSINNTKWIQELLNK